MDSEGRVGPLDDRLGRTRRPKVDSSSSKRQGADEADGFTGARRRVRWPSLVLRAARHRGTPAPFGAQDGGGDFLVSSRRSGRREYSTASPRREARGRAEAMANHSDDRVRRVRAPRSDGRGSCRRRRFVTACAEQEIGQRGVNNSMNGRATRPEEAQLGRGGYGRARDRYVDARHTSC